MDRTGLLRDIVDSAFSIDRGRKWFDIEGLEANGRVSYQGGLATAMESFQSAQLQANTDLQQLILAELTFIMQELHYCDISDTHATASLEQAASSFNDALRVLDVVEDSHLYVAVEKSYPTHCKYRYKGMPRDALHTACIAHRTRINNILRSPGINLAEKALLSQRSDNMNTAQSAYLDLQKTALGL